MKAFWTISSAHNPTPPPNSSIEIRSLCSWRSCYRLNAPTNGSTWSLQRCLKPTPHQKPWRQQVPTTSTIMLKRVVSQRQIATLATDGANAHRPIWRPGARHHGKAHQFAWGGTKDCQRDAGSRVRQGCHRCRYTCVSGI